MNNKSASSVPLRVLWRRRDVMEFLGVGQNGIKRLITGGQLTLVFLCCLECAKRKTCKPSFKRSFKKSRAKGKCLYMKKGYFRREDIVKIVEGVSG